MSSPRSILSPGVDVRRRVPRPMLALIAFMLSSCIPAGLGVPCDDDTDCDEGLVCDEHDGKGSCQQPDENTVECERVAESIVKACLDSASACRDACLEAPPDDADTIADCLRNTTDCGSARACLADTTIEGCIPEDA